jgi:YidC/Oxa1 family membrane protein insertase
MGTSTMDPKMMNALMWGMPAMTLLFTWWLPAAVQLSFFVSGLLSYMQSTLMRQTWFRNWLDMTPIPAKINTTPSAPLSPYKGNMKCAASSRPLSTTELGSRFEGPKGGLQKTVGQSKELQLPGTIKTILGAPVKGIKEAVGSITDAGKSTFESAKGAMDKRNQKSAVADRKAYEKKRQAQLKREEREKSSELRAERAARRILGRKDE